MPAPINVKLEKPDNNSNWDKESQLWIQLNKDASGNPDFYPLTIKYFYVVGIIYSICECVYELISTKNLKREISYIPAYGLYATGIEILGKCLTGEMSIHKSTLKPGLQWLINPDYKNFRKLSKNDIVVKTNLNEYSIDMLEKLRHYAAHGQSNSDFFVLDFQIIEKLHDKLIIGLQKYWENLQNSKDPCVNLSLSNISAYKEWHLYRSWILLQGNKESGPRSIIDIFKRFNMIVA